MSNITIEKALVAERMSTIKESATLAMAQKSRELASKGVDVINLSLGEPDFNTPQYIKDAAKKAIDENYSKYPPVAGFLDLRKAICEKFKRENALSFEPDQIIVSTGAKQSVINAVLSIVNPGDEVLLPIPYWVSYSEMIRFAGGIPIEVPSSVESNFKVNAQQLQKYITSKTRLMIFSSPCNPSGSVYTKSELKELAELFSDYDDIYIISDEIYEHINFTGKHESIAQFGNIKEKVIVVNGLSKSFAMTGWRLGYSASPLHIAKACNKLQGLFTSGANAITQMAAITALSSDLSETKKMNEIFKVRRDLLLNLLGEIPGMKLNVPQGAFYVFPDIGFYLGKSYQNKVIRTSYELSEFILENAHVAVVSGEGFGNDQYIRISYATSEEKLIKAVERIKNTLSQLS
jgi:aspartate aminotransferase